MQLFRGWTGAVYDRGGAVFNARAYGVLGTADDRAVIQACINAAMAANGVAVIPPGNWNIASALNISSPMTLHGYGATLTQTGVNVAGLNITSSDVTVEGLTLVSPGYATQHASSTAISVTGASAASLISRVYVRYCKLTNWAMYGIYAQFLDGFAFERNFVQNVNHGGIAMLSCSHGNVARNRVDNVVDTPNAYGITCTLAGTNSLVTNPVSSDIVVSHNHVSNVPVWEGLDTHGGLRISFIGNIVTGCKTGISAGEARDLSNNPLAGPTDILIQGNTINSGVTDGSANAGISLTGSGTAVGATVVYGTGRIIGNTIRGHGADGAGSVSGAIYVHDTLGLVIDTNTIYNPSPRGVCLYHDNYAVSATNNTVIDPWTGLNGTAPAVQVVDDYNTGTVKNNTSYATGTQSGTHVLDTHFYLANLAHNSIDNSPGYSNATTLLNDAGSLVKNSVFSGIQIGGTANPANTGFYERNDAAAVRIWQLQNLNSSSAAAVQLTLSSNGTSGGVASWGSAFTTARQAHRIGIFCNSNPSGIILDAPNSGQDLTAYIGGTSQTFHVTSTLFTFAVGMQPLHQANASAQNDTIYYSTDVSKLVYKDSGGTVNNLY